MKTALHLAVLVVGIAATTLAVTDERIPVQSSQLYIFSGTLRSIDQQARTIIVEQPAVNLKFFVPTDAEIAVKGKAKGKLGDLMNGDHIQVKYTVDDGANVAHQISVLGIETS